MKTTMIVLIAAFASTSAFAGGGHKSGNGGGNGGGATVKTVTIVNAGSYQSQSNWQVQINKPDNSKTKTTNNYNFGW